MTVGGVRMIKNQNVRKLSRVSFRSNPVKHIYMLFPPSCSSLLEDLPVMPRSWCLLSTTGLEGLNCANGCEASIISKTPPAGLFSSSQLGGLPCWVNSLVSLWLYVSRYKHTHVLYLSNLGTEGGDETYLYSLTETLASLLCFPAPLLQILAPPLLSLLAPLVQLLAPALLQSQGQAQLFPGLSHRLQLLSQVLCMKGGHSRVGDNKISVPGSNPPYRSWPPGSDCVIILLCIKHVLVLLQNNKIVVKA
jgi:hypothetical protein